MPVRPDPADPGEADAPAGSLEPEGLAADVDDATATPSGRGPGAPGLPETPWLRLSRRMLLVQPIKDLVQLVPAAFGVLIAGVAAGGLSWWMPLIVVAPIVLGILNWAMTRYRITGLQIQLRTGVVQRNVLTAHVDRVRTVDVTASPLHRLLGIAAVQVGTGAAKPFVLDGLPRVQADALREALLHARPGAPSANGHRGDPDDGGAPAGSERAPAEEAAPGAERELARFDAAWLRFAPFTLSGLVAVATAFGFAAQTFDEIDSAVVDAAASGATAFLDGRSWWVLAAIGTIVVLAALTALSLLMYAASYGGYRLTRHPGGTLRLVRGLLTTRSITVEERRIRGAVLVEPVLLRIPRGARATLLTTGLPGQSASGGSDLLVPPAPAPYAARVVEDVLEVAGAARGPLTHHGRAATLRCFTRATIPAVGLALVLGALAWWGDLPPWAIAAPVLLVVAAIPVAFDASRSLGHAVVGGHLVARSGVFPRRRSVLALPGVIGWAWSSTPFQRRVGLVTCSALTAAGPGRVDVPDVPEGAALALALDADLELVAPFLDAS